MNRVEMEQTPHPGTHLALCRGDMLEFRVRVPNASAGSAWLRTNLGAAATARAEIIAAVESNRARLARDWRDVPMTQVAPGEYAVCLPALQVGHFEAKSFYLPDSDAEPQWPAGDNVSISVAPAHLIGANGIYNAFVRQFGANKPTAGTFSAADSQVVDARATTVLGPSGTFRDLIERLDFIFDRLGCRYLLLLPVYPVPTVYGRMGLYGSPYAATDFMAVEPALARFDRAATPMQQFQELADAVHRRQGYLMLDIAVNHCGWGSILHARHPEWVLREEDQEMRSPGAWGVTWHDLTALDFDNRRLWRYVADVLLFWCRRGVDGFRCDAGYMIPHDAWEYIVAKVRNRYPDTVFMLEGLGGKISVTRSLLQGAGFNCAYSELFQQFSREQLEAYVLQAGEISLSDGILVNFAETHDNNRLAAQSHAEARLRTALAALLSHQGAFAFANGVEWFATEKIDVHGNSDLNWDAPVNQVDAIGHLNRLLRTHPVFYGRVAMRWVHEQRGSALALLRGGASDANRLLILTNLDIHNPATVEWRAAHAGIGGGGRIDLLSMSHVSLSERDGIAFYRLPPGGVLCLPGDPAGATRLLEAGHEAQDHDREPGRVLRQRALALLQTLRACFERREDTYRACTNGDEDIDGSTARSVDGVPAPEVSDPDRAAGMLLDDPDRAVALIKGAGEHVLVYWHWPRDLRRHVMLPPGHILLVKADHPFRAELRVGDTQTIVAEVSLPCSDGSHFVLLSIPDSINSGSLNEALCAAEHDCGRRDDVRLLMRVFEPDGIKRAEGVIRLLPPIERVRLPMIVPAADLIAGDGIVLRVNRMGGTMRASADWGKITGRYDALLAANLHPAHPVDRWIMLTRYRAWIEYRGHSHRLDRTCLVHIDNRATQSVRWRFSGPFAPPHEWIVDLTMTMACEENAVRLTAVLLPAASGIDAATPAGAIELVLRPDIEDRNFHEDTLAYTGPEWRWKDAVHARPAGFDFSPRPPRTLRVTADAGSFVHAPEWQYQVPHPVEARRGMRPAADLFSPGYFRIPLRPDSPQSIDAVTRPDAAVADAPDYPQEERPGGQAAAAAAPTVEDAGGGGAELAARLKDALRAYIVRRDDDKTVIAGYPWFLDWGRDTLIVARGLISAGMHREVGAILKQFGSFEHHGTLPNMIRGGDARDRDTSDAPLWFVKACDDLAAIEGYRHALEQVAGGRTLLEIARSIIDGYRRGTSNGIYVDPESGLVFSPAHFTWMDTNYPAATPRQGYPVEIQALWHAALRFMADATGEPEWRDAANQVRRSILELFHVKGRDAFIDCLHARHGQSAREAEADDALRPNQLFLITLDVLAGDRKLSRGMLAACGELLVPGALRSLADRPVVYPMPVTWRGQLLNDPRNPYQGRYEGDEDTRRKPAYHNGAAWVWLYPGYAEAWWKTYGEKSRNTALAYLGAVAPLLREGCLMQLPELLDGDAPHSQKGCDAQAWSVSETYRVLRKLG